GCYMGLRPRRSESGERKPELRITKEGDRYLRTMLVQGAHCIVSSRAPDTDLKRWGVKLAGRRQERAEAGGGSGGRKAGCSAASSVGERGSLRAAPKQPYGGRRSLRVRESPTAEFG
ncbi:MAG TPA: transposase, partial [Bryobacteraceae bacterium]